MSVDAYHPTPAVPASCSVNHFHLQRAAVCATGGGSPPAARPDRLGATRAVSRVERYGAVAAPQYACSLTGSAQHLGELLRW